MSELTPEELRRGAAAARRFGDTRLALVYEATADQIEARQNENAPGAAATTSEGNENQPNPQEGTESVNDTVHPTADTSTESCGYTLTEDGETALDVFQRRVDESQAAATVDAEDKSLFPNPRPAWSLPEWDSHSTAPAQSTMRSEEIVIPLRRHFGQFTDNTERLRLAHLEVELRQWLAEAAPIVRFSKYAAREDNKLGLIKGSTVELALDEAEQLARDLLLLVTVARTDNPGGHRG